MLAAAQTPDTSPDSPPPSVVVGALDVRYGLEHPGLPPVETLLAASARLQQVAGGVWAAGGPTDVAVGSLPTGAQVDASAVSEIAQALVRHLNAQGIFGVWVAPEGVEIRGGALVDLRPVGERALRFAVWASQVAEVRTLARGSRFAPEESINNPKHAWILENSPLAAGGAGEGDLFLRQPLERYLRGLSYHPGRRVEASIASSGEPGKVVLDYLVLETRAWQVYAQVSNTGTESSGEWRTRVGFQHNQLTSNDDILNVDLVSTFEFDTYAGFVSYQIPLVRPDTLRARVYVSAGDFASSSGEFQDLRFTGDNYLVGGELLYRTPIWANWTFNANAGVTFTNYSVASGLPTVTLSEGSSDFLTPFLGVGIGRDDGWWHTSFGLRLEHAVDGVANEDPIRGINALGRIDADASWTALRWSAAAGVYLDELFADGAPSNLAHEVSLRMRGRFLLDGSRVISQEQDLLGGAFTVRGYPESVVGADESFVASLEYAFHLPRTLAVGDRSTLFGRPMAWRPPAAQRRPDWDLIFRTFADYGYRWVGDPPSLVGGVETERALADTDLDLFGAGAGIELQILQNLSIRCDVGIALNDIQEESSTDTSVPGAVGSSVPEVPALAQSGDVRAHVIVSISW